MTPTEGEMDEQRMRQHLGQVAAYKASGLKASQWAEANGVPLRSLSSWCAHAARWQARLDGVAPAAAARGQASGFVPARLPGVDAAAAVRLEVKAGALALSIHWPLGHTVELAAWLREVAR